jgi:hypothetical protein
VERQVHTVEQLLPRIVFGTEFTCHHTHRTPGALPRAVPPAR